jgi:hypothetical protein
VSSTTAYLKTYEGGDKHIALVELITIAGTLARFSNIQKVSLALLIVSSLNGLKFLPLRSTLVPPESGPLSGTRSVIAGHE